MSNPIIVKTYPDRIQLDNILIQESGEELLRLEELEESRIMYEPVYYEQKLAGALLQCYMRKSVGEKLARIVARLPEEYGLLIFDAWRPYALQKSLYDSYYELVQKENPDASLEELKTKTLEFVSYPSTVITKPYVHGTGGAVDLTIRNLSNNENLNMGTGFDAFLPQSNTAFYETKERLTEEEIQWRDNRRWLHELMTAEGFTNLPTEWWHYDYGDSFHAYYSGRTIAEYGGILQTERT